MSSLFFHLRSVFDRVVGRKPRMMYFTSLEEADAHRREHPGVRQVIFLDDRIVKRQRPALARIEFEKTTRATRLGRQTGLFDVPGILDYDEPTGSIGFARLHGYRPLMQVLRGSESHDHLIERVAGALAAVHGHMRLPTDLTVPLHPSLCCDGTDVFLHGDFSTVNVGLTREGRLLILDWAASDLYGGEATLGPYLLDLAWFTLGLFRRSSVGWGRLQVYCLGESPAANQVGIRFIERYLSAAGRALDADLLNDYFHAVDEHVLSRKALIGKGINAASEQERLRRRFLAFAQRQFESDATGQTGRSSL